VSLTVQLTDFRQKPVFGLQMFDAVWRRLTLCHHLEKISTSDPEDPTSREVVSNLKRILTESGNTDPYAERCPWDFESVHRNDCAALGLATLYFNCDYRLLCETAVWCLHGNEWYAERQISLSLNGTVRHGPRVLDGSRQIEERPTLDDRAE
jgi:hypothetical protein